MARRAAPKTTAVPAEPLTVATVEPVPGALANKATYRVSEVAAYFDVTERTVYLWIEHGHLKTVDTPSGICRVTRESLDLCRFRPKSLRFG